MKELIHVEQKQIGQEVVQAVSARTLYNDLGMLQNNWVRWSSENIEKNEFFLEGEDWEGYIIMMYGNETKDYFITLDFAKHIAMMSKSAKSHVYRNYMIGCERRAKAQNLAHSEEVIRKIVREELNSQKFTRLLQSFPLYDLKEVAELQAEQVEIRAENERSLRKLYQMETKQDSDKHMVEIAQNLARLVKAIEAQKIPYFRSEANAQNFANSNSQVSADSSVTEALISTLDGSPYISFAYTLDAVNRVRRTTTPELVHALKGLGYECAGRKRVDGIRQNIWYSTVMIRRPDLTKAALMISGRI